MFHLCPRKAASITRWKRRSMRSISPKKHGIIVKSTRMNRRNIGKRRNPLFLKTKIKHHNCVHFLTHLSNIPLRVIVEKCRQLPSKLGCQILCSCSQHFLFKQHISMSKQRILANRNESVFDWMQNNVRTQHRSYSFALNQPQNFVRSHVIQRNRRFLWR